MMKDFIVKYGRILIDFGAWVTLIIILILGFIVLLASFQANDHGETTLITFLLLLAGIILFIIFHYTLYLLIDIRDNLAKLANPDENNQEEKNTEKKEYPNEDDDRFGKFLF